MKKTTVKTRIKRNDLMEELLLFSGLIIFGIGILLSTIIALCGLLLLLESMIYHERVRFNKHLLKYHADQLTE